MEALDAPWSDSRSRWRSVRNTDLHGRLGWRPAEMYAVRPTPEVGHAERAPVGTSWELMISRETGLRADDRSQVLSGDKERGVQSDLAPWIVALPHHGENAVDTGPEGGDCRGFDCVGGGCGGCKSSSGFCGLVDLRFHAGSLDKCAEQMF